MSSETVEVRKERDRVAQILSERLVAHDDSRRAAQEKLHEICNELRKQIDVVEDRVNAELEKKFTAEDSRLQDVLNSIRSDAATEDSEILKLIQRAKAELLVAQSYDVVECGEWVPKKRGRPEEGQKIELDLLSFCELKTERFVMEEMVELRKPTDVRVTGVTGGNVSVKFSHFTSSESKVLSKYNVKDPVNYLCSIHGKSEAKESDKMCLFKKVGQSFVSAPKTLKPGVTYELRARAELNGKESEWSDVAEFTPEYFDCYAWKECPDNVNEKRRYHIDENHPRIATRSAEEFCTVIGNDPLLAGKETSWNVKILRSHDNGNGIYIGVAPHDINQDFYSNFNSCGWYFNCYRSSLFSGPPHNLWDRAYGVRKELGKYVETGDIIGVKMGTTDGTLSFALDAKVWVVAFEGIPLDKPLVPCVILGGHEGDCVELII